MDLILSNIMGDRSLEFWRDAISFYKRLSEQSNNPIFDARFLLKTTTFVGSNEGVRQILTDKSSCFSVGYKEYLGHLFGDVVIFAENELATSMRSSLCHMLDANKPNVSSRISSMIEDYFDSLNISKQISLYSCFKELVAQILICLFLDLSPDKDKVQIKEIIALAVQHWHGIISIPISIPGPLGFMSGHRKALDARAKLCKCVSKRVECNSDQNSNDNGSLLCQYLKSPSHNSESTVDHLVLMVTALIPKAAASILSSFFLSEQHWKNDLSADGELESQILEFVLLEVSRLWPPFVGGRRIANEDVEIDGVIIPAKRPVVFLSLPAHRDPTVFVAPETFDWTRWSDPNLRKHAFAFGAGSRNCVGQDFILQIMKHILSIFMRRFQWQLCNKSDSQDYKWLPVSRPKVVPVAKLSKRQQN